MNSATHQCTLRSVIRRGYDTKVQKIVTIYFQLWHLVFRHARFEIDGIPSQLKSYYLSCTFYRRPMLTFPLNNGEDGKAVYSPPVLALFSFEHCVRSSLGPSLRILVLCKVTKRRKNSEWANCDGIEGEENVVRTWAGEQLAAKSTTTCMCAHWSKLQINRYQVVHMEHVLVGKLACAFVLKIGAFVHVDQVEGACHGHLSMPMEWNQREKYQWVLKHVASFY